MGTATELTADNFQTEVLEADQPVMVDFWAQWCGPCRQISPVIEELAVENAGSAKIGKVDVDSNQAIAEQYGVQFLPTILIFKNGEVVEKTQGALPKNRLQDLLEKHKS